LDELAKDPRIVPIQKVILNKKAKITHILTDPLPEGQTTLGNLPEAHKLSKETVK
jgi:hypothetical protein